MLWISHILIRHAGVTDRRTPFSALDWEGLPASPQRSRDEALALAESLRGHAAANPSTFPDLAAEYSDDVTSAPHAGSLGGINALRLMPWPKLLDVMASIEPGHVSRVVESPYGFHVFMRLPPPAPETLSGQHIVIGYDRAPWLARFQGRNGIEHRSRQEAMKLAYAVYEQALDPSRFPILVEQYSDHHDALWGGDFGTWSTHEATPYHREVDALRSLHVGEVSVPKDTFLGFQILLRTPLRKRDAYAANILRVPFERDGDGRASISFMSARRRAQALLARVLARPSEFIELWNQYCCNGVTVWQEGREDQRLTSAVRALKVGDVSPTIIETRSSFVIAMRVALPPVVETSGPAFELPSPNAPDIAGLMGWRLSESQLLSAFDFAAEALRSTANQDEDAAFALRAATAKLKLTNAASEWPVRSRVWSNCSECHVMRRSEASLISISKIFC